MSARTHNPGNDLHVSGLDYKIDTRDFAKIGREGQKVRDVRRFVTMETQSGEEAEAAITALHGTGLGGKEKACRGRARTPTPGTGRRLPAGSLSFSERFGAPIQYCCYLQYQNAAGQC
ncbi:hypothetical protein B0H15DRAFT_868109 [Mycena belliarum]|uniref:RRM domain-containing protein n=1 Tax=Mycena belliarum TaxID=1033014 RepID=A0AAD6TNI8_9AGAR|nr:hypothetical protein B0H15DRAFT_868109 [Mycena belliae]